MKFVLMLLHLTFQSTRAERAASNRQNRVKKALSLGVFPRKTGVSRRFESVGKHIAETCLLPAMVDVQRTSKSSVQ